MTDRI